MVMKRAILTMGFAMLMMMTVSAQVNTYIVKTRTAQQKAVAAQQEASKEVASQADENAPTDFISQNFKFYSLCDWKEGMKFMVMPEKYDLIVR